jgi:peptidoglycan/LPS O-acetylase OafA/YrhL
MGRPSTNLLPIEQRSTPRAVPSVAASECSEPTEPPWLWQGRLPSLDGLRAVSIALVIVDHLSHTSGTPVSFPRLHSIGAVGVEMFFVISGFLITLLLLREHRRYGGVSLTGFFLRRVFRIVPAYAAFLVVLFGLELSGMVHVPPLSWAHALTYSTSLFGHDPNVWDLRHTWSLSVEEHFYLLWPCLFALLSRRAALLAAAGCVAGTPFLRVALHFLLGDAHPDFRFFTPTRMDAIAIGCCLAFLATSARFRRATRLSGPWATLAVTAAAAATLTRLDEWQLIFGDGKLLRCVNAFLWETLRPILLAAMVWLCVSISSSLLGRVLNGKLLSFVGVISYGIYLWQELFLHPERQHGFGGWPARLACTFAAALLSYFLLERPLLALKERLGTRRHLVVLVAPSAASVSVGGEQHCIALDVQ